MKIAYDIVYKLFSTYFISTYYILSYPNFAPLDFHIFFTLLPLSFLINYPFSFILILLLAIQETSFNYQMHFIFQFKSNSISFSLHFKIIASFKNSKLHCCIMVNYLFFWSKHTFLLAQIQTTKIIQK